MIIFLLGISLTLNIISGIAFFIIYRYSLKGVKDKIENMAINNFVNDDNFDMDYLFNNISELRKVVDHDHK